jgi:hypothetical protein
MNNDKLTGYTPNSGADATLLDRFAEAALPAALGYVLSEITAHWRAEGVCDKPLDADDMADSGTVDQIAEPAAVLAYAVAAAMLSERSVVLSARIDSVEAGEI